MNLSNVLSELDKLEKIESSVHKNVSTEIKQEVIKTIIENSKDFIDKEDFNIKRFRMVINTCADMPPTVYYQYSYEDKSMSIILHKNPILNNTEKNFLNKIKCSLAVLTSDDNLLELYASVMSSCIDVVF